MTASVQARPPAAPTIAYGIPAATLPGRDDGTEGRHRCPECMNSFKPHQSNQLFCSIAHRAAWNNRAAVRGRVITPLAIVSRLTRQGTRGDGEIGRRASADLNLLIQRWADEDRAAGRMPHDQYLRRRYRCGFDPIT